jgi:hypothetical protein
MASDIRHADGSLDFSGGNDSGRVTTVQSAANPNGLPRTYLAWMNNCTVRGGGISPRPGYGYIGTINDGKSGLFQGGWMYQPPGGTPYLMVSIAGVIYQVMIAAFSVVNLSSQFNLVNNANTVKSYFCQGEKFLVIQSGDLQPSNTGTLPLFWDGETLTLSVGIISPFNVPGDYATQYNQLPAATAMVYYQGRIWYAQGGQYTAGDMVFGPAGTLAENYADSILYVTENPLALGGDGFSIPSNAGDIVALTYAANLDATLGLGPLYIGTNQQIFQLQVPVARSDWIAADNYNQPLQTAAQLKWGFASDRGIVQWNSDLLFATELPAIQSFTVAQRQFGSWGNIPISRPETRLMDVVDPTLLYNASGVSFDNRMLMGMLPVQTTVGVASSAIAPLDFDIISQFGGESSITPAVPPAWEGVWEGLNVLQLFTGNFNGQDRCFAVIQSAVDGSIQLWEISEDNLTDNGDNRILWQFETPAYTWGHEFDLKRLDGGELWVDQIFGTVEMRIDYRPDADPCWQPWYQTKFCAARTSCEDLTDPICYPTEAQYCDANKFPITLPRPQPGSPTALNCRPSDIGYQFQMRVTIKGSCRVRGLLLYALDVERQPFDGLNKPILPKPPAPQTTYQNTAQTATVDCADGNPFSYTVPAGMFTANSQAAANAQALQYAQMQAPLNIICLSDLAPFVINAPYSSSVVATGKYVATAPPGSNTWQLLTPLPPGIQFGLGGPIQVLSSNEWPLTGSSPGPGTFIFTVQITDTKGNVMAKTYNMTCWCITNLINFLGLPVNPQVGVPFSFQLETYGFSPETVFTLRTDLGPINPGLQISPTGLIYGTPTASGPAGPTVTMTDPVNGVVGTQTINIDVIP